MGCSLLASGGRTSDLACRAALASRDHDQQLHDGVVDLRTAGLDDEDVLVAGARQDADAGFALWWLGSPFRSRSARRSSRAAAMQPSTIRGFHWPPTFENWVSSAEAGAMPRFSHILLLRSGHDVPEKMRVLRMVEEVENPWRNCRGGGCVRELFMDARTSQQGPLFDGEKKAAKDFCTKNPKGPVFRPPQTCGPTKQVWRPPQRFPPSPTRQAGTPFCQALSLRGFPREQGQHAWPRFLAQKPTGMHSRWASATCR